MIRLGLIGEDPNDTTAIQNLLQRQYQGVFSYIRLLPRMRGGQLLNEKVGKALQIEFDSKRPDIVLFIKDADALPSETEKLNKVKKWFTDLNAAIGGKGLLLLNIFELEALILADIATFNKIYGTSIAFTGNVMFKEDPKGFLKTKTYRLKKTYSESDSPGIFDKLEIRLLQQKCGYFKEFLLELDKIINAMLN